MKRLRRTPRSSACSASSSTFGADRPADDWVVASSRASATTARSSSATSAPRPRSASRAAERPLDQGRPAVRPADPLCRPGGACRAAAPPARAGPCPRRPTPSRMEVARTPDRPDASRRLRPRASSLYESEVRSIVIQSIAAVAALVAFAWWIIDNTATNLRRRPTWRRASASSATRASFEIGQHAHRLFQQLDLRPRDRRRHPEHADHRRSRHRARHDPRLHRRHRAAVARTSSSRGCRRSTSRPSATSRCCCGSSSGTSRVLSSLLQPPSARPAGARAHRRRSPHQSRHSRSPRRSSSRWLGDRCSSSSSLSLDRHRAWRRYARAPAGRRPAQGARALALARASSSAAARRLPRDRRSRSTSNFRRATRLQPRGGRRSRPEHTSRSSSALSIYTGAFIAEIVRAGILAVVAGPVGGGDGARPPAAASRCASWSLPQAFRVIIPPLISPVPQPHQELLARASPSAIPSSIHRLDGIANQAGQRLEIVADPGSAPISGSASCLRPHEPLQRPHGVGRTLKERISHGRASPVSSRPSPSSRSRRPRRRDRVGPLGPQEPLLDTARLDPHRARPR